MLLPSSPGEKTMAAQTGKLVWNSEKGENCLTRFFLTVLYLNGRDISTFKKTYLIAISLLIASSLVSFCHTNGKDLM